MRGTLFDLTGRVALVTGGSKGLGKAMAGGFAAGRGRVVPLQPARRAAARRRPSEIRAASGVPRRVRSSPTWPGATTSTAWPTTAVERLGKVDILVNNAGWNVPQAIDEIRDEDWDHLRRAEPDQLHGADPGDRAGMKERRWGRVIHISSIMGLASTPERNAYSATKAALIGLAQASALDLGPFGITVNCIAPGPFATEMPMSILSKQQQDALAGRTALGRWGRPEELAGPALLLASEAGSYITGTVLVVDGGARGPGVLRTCRQVGAQWLMTRTVSCRLPTRVNSHRPRHDFPPASPGLDELLGGGLLPGTLTVVVGSTGIGKTQLGLQFAQAGLGAGRPRAASSST